MHAYKLGATHAADQRGQAMVEFLVAAMFVLVPLFLAISVVGKFANVQHTADAAARYATWERTVWYESSTSNFEKNNGTNVKSATEIRNETAVRVLNDRSSSTSVIKSTDKTASSFVNGLDPMWRDPANGAYLANYSQLNSTLATVAETKGTAEQVIAAISKLPLVDEELDVAKDTLATASIDFKDIAKNSAVYQRLWSSPGWLGLDFSAKGAILSNTWAANGRAGSLQMAIGLVAARNPANKSVKAGYGIVAPMVAWDPVAMGGLDIGKIAVDEVPSDRLK
jgi:Flp pilus assembly protein TadG